VFTYHGGMLPRSPQRDRDLDFRQVDHYPVFDALRIFAGLMVIYSHSFVLVGRAEPSLAILGQYRITVGHAGVVVFFVLSGFLVTQSWQRKPTASSYSLKRFSRIWPGYTAVVVLSALVLGPIVTTLSLADYLTAKQTWLYILRTVLMSPVQFDLPGVFTSQPVSAVNGSLWTLPYEILAYAALLVLGLIGILKRPIIVLGLTVAALGAVRLAIQTRTIDLDTAANGINLIAAVNLGAWFLTGVCLFLFRDSLRWTNPIGVVAAVVVGVGIVFGESLLVIPAASYLLIFLGTRPWAFVDVVRRPGDPSYGIYLYGFPIQQTLVWSGIVGANPWALMVLASPIAIAFGYLSWLAIEKPSMRSLRGWVGRLGGSTAGRRASSA